MYTAARRKITALQRAACIAERQIFLPFSITKYTLANIKVYQ